MSNYLNYIMKMNGTKGKSVKDVWIEEMADSLNEGMRELLTKFRIEINSDKAKNVKIDGKIAKCLIKEDTKESETTGTYTNRIQAEIGDIKEGSRIDFINDKSYGNETYFVMTKVEKINDYSQAYIRYCNRSFRLKKADTFEPIALDNTTYGVKGIKDNDIFKEPDAKMKAWVQANNYTKDLMVGMRLLFDGKSEFITTDKKEWVAYKILKKDFVVLSNQYVMELELSTIIPGKDDLENGIAYNPMLDDTDIPSGEFKIIGEESIGIDETKEYTIEPNTTQRVAFRVSDNNIATIVTQDFKGKCILKGLKEDFVKLEVVVGNQLKDFKWIMVHSEVV